MNKVSLLSLLLLLSFSIGSLRAEENETIRVSGTVYAPSPCSLAYQCGEYSKSLLCVAQIVPLAGEIEFKNRKGSVLTELLGGFKAKLKAGRYNVNFKRFDGIASNCIERGKTIKCSEINNSELYSPDIEIKSRARVTKTNRFISLPAQAKSCK